LPSSTSISLPSHQNNGSGVYNDTVTTVADLSNADTAEMIGKDQHQHHDNLTLKDHLDPLTGQIARSKYNGGLFLVHTVDPVHWATNPKRNSQRNKNGEEQDDL